MECYKNTLSQLDIKNYNKKEMKFYRKLRATSVNFELDKLHLDDACQKKVKQFFTRMARENLYTI